MDTKAYLKIDGYELSGWKDRTDTVNGRGGGLLVYSKHGLVVTEVEHKTDFNQVLAVSVCSYKIKTTYSQSCLPFS